MKVKLTKLCILNGIHMEPGTVHEVGADFPFMHCAQVIEEPVLAAAPAEPDRDKTPDPDALVAKSAKVKKEK
jgi:hypothetical protein